MKNKRLGRGLEALIPQVSPDEDPVRRESLAEINVAKVRANPYQPRMEFNGHGLGELKQSILENGIIQPITVRKADDGFELIAGERRLRAVQELGFKRIPAYVIEVTSEDQMLELALVENIQREDLNPIDLALAYRRLQKEYGLTQEDVAKKVGKDRTTIANFVRLLKLPEVIQKSLRKDEIAIGHAKAFMGLSSLGEQIQVWRRVVKHGWSVRKVEEAVRDELADASVKKEKRIQERPSYMVEIEEKLRSALGTRVHLKSAGSGGKIEISYYSDEDLDRIVDSIFRSME